jgi:hypothetical protein
MASLPETRSILNVKFWIGNLLAFFVLCQSGLAQGFMNLDFASANLSAYGTGGGFVPATDAIPDWTIFVGGIQQTSVLYNNLTVGEAAIAILGKNSSVGQVIPGNNYTVVLQASLEDTASIAQTGLIPNTAESIFFTASSPYSSGWQMMVAGQNVPVFQVSSVTSGVYVYEGNISAFAGQTDELEFTALAGGNNPVNMYLDSISFSPSPVPEPSALGLSALGGLFLVWRRWQKFPQT